MMSLSDDKQTDIFDTFNIIYKFGYFNTLTAKRD